MVWRLTTTLSGGKRQCKDGPVISWMLHWKEAPPRGDAPYRKQQLRHHGAARYRGILNFLYNHAKYLIIRGYPI